MENIASIAVFLLAWLARSSAMPVAQFGMPASCAGSHYCTERHELYPQTIVNSLMETINISFSDERPILPPVVIHRDGDDTDERDCEVLFTDDLIYEIVDADDVVRVVVQADNNHQQELQIKRCARPGHIASATTHFSQDIVDQFDLHCEEQKLEYSFLVLTKDWEGVEMVKPKTGIPVECDCKLYGLK